MALLRGGGYGHRINRIDSDVYLISWNYDVKYRRIRFPRSIRRITDRAGAVRFAKKWNCNLP